MANIIPLNFEGNSVRSLSINNEPHFVAVDVARCLGYADTDQAIRKNCKHAESHPVSETGQVRHLKCIPESDIYRLVMRSKLPEAERFADWVMEEVLPSIRETGSYHQDVPTITATQMNQITQAFANFNRYFKHWSQRASSRLHRKLKQQFNVPSWERLPVTKLDDLLRELKIMEHQAHGIYAITSRIELTYIAYAIYRNESDRVYDVVPDELKALVGGDARPLAEDLFIPA